MKRKKIKLKILCCLFLGTCNPLFPGERAEHREFARIALDSVLSNCKDDLHVELRNLFIHGTQTPLWNKKSFAEISAFFAEKDRATERSHIPRHSILDQLRPLSASIIESAWRKVQSNNNVKSLEQKGKNVVVNYLLHHLIALRLASAVTDTGNLKLALSYEAIALGYLVDAFSSAHILVKYKSLSWLQPLNYKKAHAFFRSKGAFVINSKGEAWQTFGDELMLWYEPTYRHVLQAARTSIGEVLLAFHIAVDAKPIPHSLLALGNSLPKEYPVKAWVGIETETDFYDKLRLPSLLHLPMPVAATWSKKSDIVDKHGIHQRIHYPQLREVGYHDPDLDEVTQKHLWSRDDIGDSLIFEEFRRVDEIISKDDKDKFARKIFKEDKNFASVRFIQPKKFSPSYYGLLVNAAGGASFNGDSNSTFIIGAGWGLSDKLLFFNNPSFDALYTRIFAEKDRHFISVTFGLSVTEPLIPEKISTFIKAFRLELGSAQEIGESSGLIDDLFNYKIAVGIELPMLEFPFTYAGLTSRIMVQRIFTGSSLHGVYFQIVLH